MTKSFLVSAFILLCATIIESAILSNISFLMVVPDLVLISSVYLALINGKLCGEVNGFISGIFLDFITGIPFGFNALIRTLIGYIGGFFYDTMFVGGIFVPVASASIATVLKYLLIGFTGFFFPNVNIYKISIFSSTFLFELVLNIILAPFIFKFLNYFKRVLSFSTIGDRIDNV